MFKENNVFSTTVRYGSFTDLKDMSGHIMSRKEWEELKIVMDYFYELNTDKEIESYNAGAIERRMKEIQEFQDRTRKYKEMQTKLQKPSFLYFLGYPGKGVKIGYTQHLKKRISQLQVASPIEIYLLGKIETLQPNSLEKQAHAYFAHKIITGEWFDITEKEVADFIQMYNIKKGC